MGSLTTRSKIVATLTSLALVMTMVPGITVSAISAWADDEEIVAQDAVDDAALAIQEESASPGSEGLIEEGASQENGAPEDDMSQGEGQTSDISAGGADQPAFEQQDKSTSSNSKSARGLNRTTLAEDGSASDEGGSTSSEREARMSVKLLYDDGAQAISGAFKEYSTYDEMMGYVEIETHNYASDVQDVTLDLIVPAQYVKDGSFRVKPVTTEGTTRMTINDAVREDDTYRIRIDFSNFDKTQTLRFPFHIQFAPGTTPANYTLPVTATLNYDEKTASAEPVNFQPKYGEYGFIKYLDNSRSPVNANDNRHVRVTLDQGTSSPQVADGSEVAYAFRVEKPNSSLVRDIESITVTDTLPEGMKLAEGKNEGWASWEEDGRIKVSKQFTGESTDAVLDALSSESLVLDAGGVALAEDTSQINHFTASVKNTASFVAVPRDKAEGEAEYSGEDSLSTVLDTRALASGSTGKYVSPDKIYDTKSYRSGEVNWRFLGYNSSAVPLQHVSYQDCYLSDDDKLGMDERLKFTRLSSAVYSLPSGQTVRDIIDRVVVHYEGSGDEVIGKDSLQFDGDGNFSIVFDESKVCTGYEVYLDNDYAMASGDGIWLDSSSTYRDPNSSAFNHDDPSKNLFWNTGRMSYDYPDPDDPSKTVYQWSWSSRSYELLEFAEQVEIQKDTYYNSPTQNSSPGDRFAFLLTLTGALEDDKDYENLRVIDLLPEGLEYTGLSLNTAGVQESGISVVKNYKDTGRDAVIFPLDVETLKAQWAESNRAHITLHVKISDDAALGVVTNDVYVVGDNLNDYRGAKGVTDSGDFDEDGNADDQITHASSVAYITGNSTIFAYESIAPAGTDKWTRTGLYGDLGEDFDYLLRVQNEESDKTGAVIYNVLPQTGDKDIFVSGDRNSEMGVKLRGPVEVPAGYKVYYTTSSDVYSSYMTDMIDADVWTSVVSDFSTVTAIKVVADENTKIAQRSALEVKMPVTLPESFTNAEESALKKKFDDNPGEISYLMGINGFGYQVDGFESPKQSNTVWLGTTDLSVPKTTVSVKKIWDDADNQDGVRPSSISIVLVRNDEVTSQTVTLDEGNTWEAVFDDLPVYVDGEIATYSVREADVPAEYESALEGTPEDGYIITNVHVPELVDIDVTKVWVGGEGDSVTVNLSADGTVVDTKTIVSTDAWTATFTGLPKYSNGTEIAYAVTEDAVEGYTSEVTGSVAEGFTVTNRKKDVNGDDRDDPDEPDDPEEPKVPEEDYPVDPGADSDDEEEPEDDDGDSDGTSAGAKGSSDGSGKGDYVRTGDETDVVMLAAGAAAAAAVAAGVAVIRRRNEESAD